MSPARAVLPRSPLVSSIVRLCSRPPALGVAVAVAAREERAAGGEVERSGRARWVSLFAARVKQGLPRASAVNEDSTVVDLPCDRPSLRPTGGAGNRPMEVRDSGAQRPSPEAVWLRGELRRNLSSRGAATTASSRHFDRGCGGVSAGDTR